MEPTANNNPNPPSNLNFGDALALLKRGNRVARSGWNGKGMWIALTPGSVVDTGTQPVRGALDAHVRNGAPRKVTIGAHIDMKAADGSLVIGWLASQTDMLAEDWMVL